MSVMYIGPNGHNSTPSRPLDHLLEAVSLLEQLEEELPPEPAFWLRVAQTHALLAIAQEIRRQRQEAPR